ncbi:hypothetical protein [Calothrix sp. NIES-2100]
MECDHNYDVEKVRSRFCCSGENAIACVMLGKCDRLCDVGEVRSREFN